ncbi:protein-tyrosine phosphatase-like protein [Cytidiella melzeri]|nr:protein-tyrosine phosphatase-like protein [Cytidiella melzeri]
MDAATPRAQGAFPKCKQALVPLLLIETPSQHEDISPVLAGAQQTSPAVSSATSNTDSFIFSPSSRPQSRTMNRKRLSLSLPSAQLSLSVISLPNTSTSSLLHRKDEDGDDSSTVPYVDGPIQILPGIWLGNEDSTRDWQGLLKRGIKSVLNVAKKVVTSFDSTYPQHGQVSMSTPDLNMATSSSPSDSTFFPAHLPSGRPAMHYLRLSWSHGQSDLVSSGFPVAMSFVDQALLRGDSVLIHCQCGVSRSATLVIALVMQASARCSPYAPEEVWAMKGNMQAAYSYVKEKSKWAIPNMAEDEEDWACCHQMVEDTNAEDNDCNSMEVMRKAQALDKAMEYCRVARKNSTSSVSSATSTGLGMGAAWRKKYGPARKRAGSIASTGSFLSEKIS